MRRVALLLGLTALLAAGFAAAGGASSVHADKGCKKGYHRVKGKCVKVKKKTTTKKTTTTTKTSTTPTTTTPGPKGGFPAGVYFAVPNPTEPGTGTVKLLGGSIPKITIQTGRGMDVGQVLVWTTGVEVHVVQPNGSARILYPDGLFDISHPSLSPDGKFVAVQATETDPDAGADDQWQNVYAIDLSNGTWTRVAYTGPYPYDGNDLPAWLNATEIAYQATEQVNGQGCRVVDVADVATGAVKRTLRGEGNSACETQVSPYWESPRVQMSPSADGTKLFLAGTLQILDASSGAVLANLKEKVLAGLQAAGYAPDHRYPSRAGSTPAALAGSLAPDLKSVVFDGAVEKDFHYYQLVMQIGTDGNGFKILAGPFEADEPFRSGNAYSLLNAVYKS